VFYLVGLPYWRVGPVTKYYLPNRNAQDTRPNKQTNKQSRRVTLTHWPIVHWLYIGAGFQRTFLLSIHRVTTGMSPRHEDEVPDSEDEMPAMPAGRSDDSSAIGPFHPPGFLTSVLSLRCDHTDGFRYLHHTFVSS
jgi:hypothetical protein